MDVAWTQFSAAVPVRRLRFPGIQCVFVVPAQLHEGRHVAGVCVERAVLHSVCRQYGDYAAGCAAENARTGQGAISADESVLGNEDQTPNPGKLLPK